MTLLLLRRYLAEPRLIWTAVMVSSMFAMGGDMGVFLAFFSTVVAFVVYPNRATVFEASLPISARTILRARLLATFVFALTPVVVWLVAMRFSHYAQLSRDLMPDFVGRPLTDFDRLGFAAIITIAATLPLMISSRSLKRPSALQLLVGYAALCSGSTAIFFVVPPQFAFVLFALIAIIAVVRTLTHAPESFQAADEAFEQEHAPSRIRSGTDASGNGWLVSLVRSSLTVQWFIFALLIMLQASLGSWISMIGIPFALLTTMRRKTVWISSLPISNRARLMLTFVPVMAGTFGSIVIGQFVYVPGLNHRSFNPISWQAVYTPYEPGKYFSSKTSMKLMYWEIAPNGVAPVITSPSGESVTAYTLKVPGFTLYNPYSSNEKSTKEFIAWQYSRASTRVYGHAVPVPQTYDDGLVFPPPLYAVPRVQILNAAAVLCLMMLLYIAAQSASYRAPRGKGFRQVFGEWFAVLPGFLCIFIDGFYGTSHGTQIVVPLAKRLLLNLSDALPANIVAVVLVSAIPVAILYAIIEWQFARTELVPTVVVKRT